MPEPSKTAPSHAAIRTSNPRSNKSNVRGPGTMKNTKIQIGQCASLYQGLLRVRKRGASTCLVSGFSMLAPRWLVVSTINPGAGQTWPRIKTDKFCSQAVFIRGLDFFSASQGALAALNREIPKSHKHP